MTCGAMPSPQDLSRGKADAVEQSDPQRRVGTQRTDRRGRSRRTGAHNGQVPVGHEATTVSRTTSTRAMAIAA